MSVSNEISKDEQVIHDNSAARKINNLLNSSKTRMEGLELLNSFLFQCSDDDFINFCLNWMQNCCKIDPLTKTGDFAINLLCNLFKLSSNYQELKKSVSFFITTRYFDFFFKYFLNSQAGWSCTETCLLLYRGACGPFQENLEKHLRNEIKKNVKMSLVCCKCYALVPSIGGGGKEGINYKRNWKNYFVEFLNICLSVLDDLFVGLEELQEFEIFELSFKKNERSSEYLATQLYNHCSILMCMLLNQYPAFKSIPSDMILQLVCRGLSMNPTNLPKRETAEIISLRKVLPDIHYTLLSLLKALIVTCKTQLFPYSQLICKLIKQSLEWTKSDSIHSRENLLGRLRISIYETLCNWLAVAGGGSCVEDISSVTVFNAVSDIRSKKCAVFLKDAALGNRSKSKEETSCLFNVTANSRVCFAALKALQCLLKFAGVLLRAEEHKFLQEVTVNLLVEVQKSSTPDVISPFALSDCRLELYALLLELVHNSCPKWPPPINLALRLFGRGINDNSPEVSSLCSTALSSTMIIIHPQYDNGGFSLYKSPCNEKRMDVEVQETEPLESEKNKDSEISPNGIPENVETVPESNDQNPSDSRESFSDLSRESGVSSDEDSRNTVKFLKDAESSKINNGENENVRDQTSPVQETSLSTCKPSSKIRRTSNNDTSFEQVKEKPFESCSVKETSESKETSLLDLSSAKSNSLESLNDVGQPKARYFLRSKTKGSSEEPEEVSKRTSSSESSKSSPFKSSISNTPVLQTARKRLRGRTIRRIEANNRTENESFEKIDQNNKEEEEEIKAAFNDSLAD